MTQFLDMLEEKVVEENVEEVKSVKEEVKTVVEVHSLFVL